MTRNFHGRGGTRRGVGARSQQEGMLFDDMDPDDSPARNPDDDAELARDVNRMTLATSSGVYARRRAE